MLWFKSKSRKLKEECWNLNGELVKWVYLHLIIYKEDASRIVDLNYYKHMYRGKEYTTEEIIDMLIQITSDMLDYDEYIYDIVPNDRVVKENKNQKARINKMYDLLKLIHEELWW